MENQEAKTTKPQWIPFTFWGNGSVSAVMPRPAVAATRCHECGIANGWHTSKCKTGLADMECRKP